EEAQKERTRCVALQIERGGQGRIASHSRCFQRRTLPLPTPGAREIGRRRPITRVEARSPATLPRLRPGQIMYAGNSSGGQARKVTVPELRDRKVAAGGAPLHMVTAYDFTMARLADEAGVDMVLVGDSLGMVVQGLQNTIPVTLDEICYHGRAVARGLARAHVVGDMPFMSYQVSAVQAVESAGKLMKDGAFESVKLEGGAEVAEHVHRIVRAGIPVVGHVGLTPQSVHALGGLKVQGRGEDDADRNPPDT